MALHVVGVRHHSPACARLVAQVIGRVRPRHVLVEGPADMNDRIDELLLPHTLPIAIFSYHHGDASDGGAGYASWSPFCDYSPEWVALRAARAVGAEARFIDLPSWASVWSGVRNRYADRHSKWSARVTALCERLGVEDSDALWDQLFEQPMAEEELARRLATYFAELRDGEPAGERDTTREAFMARCIAWAMVDTARRGGDVVVVCGGFHAPALEKLWSATGNVWPELPVAKGRAGSYLVPYSFHRLDSFVGYESGMPSPAYYQAVWEVGAAAASERLLAAAVGRLRDKRQAVSAADAIAARALTDGLARLRGHGVGAETVATRVDLLDGLAGALVKEALEVPLPWSRRGTLAPRTDPLLVEVVAAFSGDGAGALAPGTLRPPLVGDVAAELAALELVPPPSGMPRQVELSLARDLDVRRSRTLHRLRLLEVPGFRRERAPSSGWARDPAALGETWRIVQLFDAESALIEASAYGATLEAAATARLEEQLARAADLGALAFLVGEATLIGIASLGARALGEIAAKVAQEPDLEVLGEALARLLGLWRHDTLLGAAGAPSLATVIGEIVERGLWLVEGLRGDGDGEADAGGALVSALVALRDAVRHHPTVDRARAAAVMQRRAVDRDAPPVVRGGALGFLWSTGGAGGSDEAVRAVRGAARPRALGDFLVGLFALAREEVIAAAGLLGAVDEVVCGLSDADFLVAVPSLRLAFSFFPPAERERIAGRLLSLHRREPAAAHELLRGAPDGASPLAAQGAALEAAADELARRYGLDEGEPRG